MVEIFWVGIILDGNFPGGNCLAESYLGGNFLSGSYPGWEFPDGYCPMGIIQVAIFLVPVYDVIKTMFPQNQRKTL